MLDAPFLPMHRINLNIRFQFNPFVIMQNYTSIQSSKKTKQSDSPARKDKRSSSQMITSEFYSSFYMNCNALKMPIDHKVATLQFEKGHEGDHGAKLHCSHPSCKINGVKFLYYIFQIGCRFPVLMGNFPPPLHA